MAEIRFLGCDNDVFCSSVAARADEFQQISGHQVTVQLLGNDYYYTNKLADYLGGDNPADVYMSGTVLAWEQLGRGFVRPLDEFAGRASAGYDFADFFGRLIRGSRWTGHFGDAARRWTRALRDAYRGEGSLEQCLGQAASDIDRFVVRA